MSAVAITRHDDIERAVEQALEHIPLDDLVSGRLVAVKPNDTWASSEDTTGVTQPDTLRAVLRRLQRLGPRRLVVTGGAGTAETDDLVPSRSTAELRAQGSKKSNRDRSDAMAPVSQ